MRANLAKVMVVIGVGLAAFAAIRIASHFFDSPFTPALASAAVMAAFILALRWWYRGEPQAIDPARQRRLLLLSLATSLFLGAAGVVAATVVMHSASALPDCSALPH